MMTNTTTTTHKPNHHSKALLTLMAVLAVAMLLGVAGSAHASTTFTVNSVFDFADTNPGDGVCDFSFGSDQPCSLRAAIQEANATPGADTIDFAIPAGERDPSTGVATIKPLTPLPPITDRVTIDGYTQPGASPNTKPVGDDAVLKIELNGSKALFTGLQIQDSSGSVIRGLDLHGFGTGVLVSGSSVGNRIEGDFVGTDPLGTSLPGNSSYGVSVTSGASQTVVGGATLDKRNVISGNGGGGIFIDGSNGSIVKGNYVGTDKTGTLPFANDSFGGVFVQGATGTTVGGTTAASRNLVSGNTGDGVVVVFSQGTEVLGNRIGTTASGASPLGNDAMGVDIGGSASGTLVGDGTAGGSNTIAFNAQDGVQVTDQSPGAATVGNRVSRDTIFSNGGLGIDLAGPGETKTTDVINANDPLDADAGPNDLQNRPSIGSAKTVSGATTIKGTLGSEANKTYRIEFYSNPQGTDEGKKFIGAKSVTTGADGKATFALTPATKISVGQTITATATNSSTLDTSEFSAPRKVAAS